MTVFATIFFPLIMGNGDPVSFPVCNCVYEYKTLIIFYQIYILMFDYRTVMIKIYITKE
jgi:hypothetical protein